MPRLKKAAHYAAHEDEAAKHALEQAISSAHNAEMLMLGGTLIALLVGVGLGYSIISGIVRSTGEMSTVMASTAADGDLTRAVRVHGKDEMAKAARAFNTLMDSFRTTIRQVHGSADTVISTAAQLAASSTKITQGSQVQSEAAASTAAAVEEITVSINAVAANTEDVRKLSEQSLQQTRNGNQSVTEMIGEIQSVQNAVNQIEGSVKEFVDSTRAIAGMTQQVKDIADQTNLLALNAAIEAARAGEQGRGFAVVADEVRKLAEKSAQSASEIDQVTNSLNQKSAHVEATVQEGLRSLKATQEYVARVSVVLTEAGESVTKSSNGVNDIAVVGQRAEPGQHRDRTQRGKDCADVGRESRRRQFQLAGYRASGTTGARVAVGSRAFQGVGGLKGNHAKQECIRVAKGSAIPGRDGIGLQDRYPGNHHLCERCIRGHLRLCA